MRRGWPRILGEEFHMTVQVEGTIEAAEKIAELIVKAPAGGIFHDAVVSDPAGIEVPGYAGLAGFTLDVDGKRFDVVVQRTR
jgi:hypothetical protein